MTQHVVKGHGLAKIDGRAKFLNGTCTIESPDIGSTTIHWQVPR